MISWPAPATGVGICSAGAADAPLASDNDNPAAAPSVGTAFLKRLRFADCLACGMEENLSLRA
jgi:hypothetical protein